MTIRDIEEKWAHIKRRCRSWAGSSQIATLLDHCDLVELSPGTPPFYTILWIRPHFIECYETLASEPYRTIVNWALRIEMGEQSISVRYLDPPC